MRQPDISNLDTLLTFLERTAIGDDETIDILETTLRSTYLKDEIKQARIELTTLYRQYSALREAMRPYIFGGQFPIFCILCKTNPHLDDCMLRGESK